MTAVRRPRLNAVTDSGQYIVVDPAEAGAQLPALLKAVEESGRIVRIVREGQPVAELVPVRPQRRPPQGDPDLTVKFSPDYDPVEPLSEDDWPQDAR